MIQGITTLSAPLRVTAFRAIWLAQVAAALGTFMQTVGAQWYLADVGASATIVSLVQTAAMLPVFLFGLLAGVIADRVDRRLLLLVVQCGTTTVAGLLVLVTVVGWLNPVLLLIATFLLGVGFAFTQPVVSAVLPELVERPLIPAASTLAGLNFNIGRLVGPALGGAIIALAGPWAVFAANMLASLIMLAAVATWRPAPSAARPRPRLTHAVTAGLRYVRFAPIYRRVLWCTLLWIVPASAVQALLPLVAHDELALGAGGYGVLLGALGLGALTGSPLINRLAGVAPNRLFLGCSVVFAAVAAVVAWAGSAVAVGVALFVGGAAWMVILTTITSLGQLVLPGWVRGRATSMFLLLFFGGQAFGSVLWGTVATSVSLRASLLASAVLLVGAGILTQWRGLRPIAGVDPVLDERPSTEDDPDEPSELDAHLLLVAEYDVHPDNVDAFRDALPRLGQSRRRTGARRWTAYQDLTVPTRFVETYELPSWSEHVSQTTHRQTRGESQLVADVLALTDRTVARRTLVGVATATRAATDLTALSQVDTPDR